MVKNIVHNSNPSRRKTKHDKDMSLKVIAMDSPNAKVSCPANTRTP